MRRRPVAVGQRLQKGDDVALVLRGHRRRLPRLAVERRVGDIDIALEPGVNPGCAQSAPNLRASRTPCHGDNGWGGRQRLSATGAAANGIPLKLDTSPSVTPRTIPVEVRTVGLASGVKALILLPGIVCANVHSTLIKKQNPRLGKFDLTFVILYCLSAFSVQSSSTWLQEGGRLRASDWTKLRQSV